MMPVHASHADVPYLQRRLPERMDELRSQIDRARRRKLEEERPTRIPGEASDPVGSSVAVVTFETESATLQRDEAELRELDGALARIAAGSYGICLRCGKPLERARLEANAAAQRYALCQKEHDELKLARTPREEQ
jgi:RNA polymerase-binding transcription factor DksA